jgi:hypothetical protein
MKLIYNPGGFCASRHTQKYESGRFTGCRTRYTNAEKVNILSVVRRLQTEQHFSLTLAAQFVQIAPPVICRWAKKAQELQCDSKKAGKMSCHAGPASLVDDIEEALLNFIDEWRQKGFEVNRFTLLRKAYELKPELRERSEPAAKICLSRFLARNNLTHRVATHKAQRDPREVEAEALDFLEYIRPRLSGPHRAPDYILNMDQTLVYHAMCGGKTIELVGARTVNMRTPSGSADSKRVTVAACITASGRQVQPMVVFKGESTNVLW